MATEKLVAGGVGSFTLAHTSTTLWDSLASTNALLGDLDLDNSTNLDLLAEFEFIGGSVTTTGSPFLSLYLYPKNSDNSYGDTRFASAAAGPPPANYLRGFLGLPVGTQAIKGQFLFSGQPYTPLSRGIFRPVLYNGAGVNFGAGPNFATLKWRTTNRTVA